MLTVNQADIYWSSTVTLVGAYLKCFCQALCYWKALFREDFLVFITLSAHVVFSVGSECS